MNRLTDEEVDPGRVQEGLLDQQDQTTIMGGDQALGQGTSGDGSPRFLLIQTGD